MAGTTNWRTEGVKVVRDTTIAEAMAGASGAKRVTALEFSGTGGSATWIGRVSVDPGDGNGPHHHGRHEVMLYVVSGRGLIRWGERLEFAAEITPGDFVYFAPFVPHNEQNLDPANPLELLVMRSDNERIAIPIETDVTDPPETAS